MEIIKKMPLVLCIIFCLIAVFSINSMPVLASVKSKMNEVSTGQEPKGDELKSVVGKILGLLRLLTGLLSIVVIAYTGFTFVTETPEGKAKVKDKMIPIVVGILLTFMATNIAVFIVGLFE